MQARQFSLVALAVLLLSAPAGLQAGSPNTDYRPDPKAVQRYGMILRDNLIAMWAPNEATPYIKPGECKVDMELLTGTL